MKKLAFLILVISFTLNAQDRRNYDEEKWGTVAHSGGDIKTYNDLQTTLNSFDYLIKRAVGHSIFISSDFASLEDFNNKLGQISLYINMPKIEKTNSSNFAYKAGEDAIKGLSGELYRLERIRRKLILATNTAYGSKLPQRKKVWQEAIQRIDNWGYSKDFAEFDLAFGQFMKYCDEMARNKAEDVSGSEIAMISKLDKFINQYGKTSPSFDRNLRTLDNYLFALRREALNFYKETLNQFKSELEETRIALNTYREAFNTQNDLKLQPSDRKVVSSIYENIEIIISSGEDLVKQSEELIKKVEDNSSEFGKLRNLQGFNNNGAFSAYGSAKSDGTQNYTGRVRVALEDCRNKFIKEAKKINGDNWKW